MKMQFGFTDDYIIGTGGLALAGHLIKKINFVQKVNQVNLKEAHNPEIRNSDVLVSYIGLLCQGKNDFDHIEAFRDDTFYRQALGIRKVPSSPTLRQRLDTARDSFREIILNENANLLLAGAPTLTSCSTGHAVIDIDVSPFDNSNTKKEGVGYTYKKVDGYAPIFAYLGEEGYCINLQLREGTQHCQCDTEGFLADTIKLAKKVSKKPLLVRMDSGNDSGSNIRIMQAEQTKADYIIKRNLRREKKSAWLAVAQTNGTISEPREGKKVWTGSLMTQPKGNTEKSRMIYKVTERTMTPDGQLLMCPEIEVEAWWTSLTNVTEEAIIKLYKEHGTSEQFHSEIKTDMDLERLPSGKFKTNSLVLELAMIAYNILRILGQESIQAPGIPLRKKAARRRIRTVIQNLITIAGKVVKHAGQIKLCFSKKECWAVPWMAINAKLA
jgi:plasmid maintenance system antidote protein VapI